MVEKGPLGLLIEAWDVLIPSTDESNIDKTTITNCLLSLVLSIKLDSDNKLWLSDISKVYLNAII